MNKDGSFFRFSPWYLSKTINQILPIFFKKVVKRNSMHFFPVRHLPVFPEKKLTLQKSSIFLGRLQKTLAIFLN